MSRTHHTMPSRSDIERFVTSVLDHYRNRGRDSMPWRETSDAYAILVSEVMAQQTQIARVLPKYTAWMERFPTPDALAAAPLESVLELWQGLGYNRRAIALKKAAEEISTTHAGIVPRSESALLALPGVGPATAAGVRAFAYGEPGRYLETNVRAALLNDFFPDQDGVSDRELLPVLDAVLEAALNGSGDREATSPRTWYYALMDYGAHLKATRPNPSRSSKHHARQSKFEGSHRQKRARALRAVMASPGITIEALAEEIVVDLATAERIAGELVVEGFLQRSGDALKVAT